VRPTPPKVGWHFLGKALIGTPFVCWDFAHYVIGCILTQKTNDLGDEVTIRSAKAEDAGFIQDLSKRVFEQYGPYERVLMEWFVCGRT